MSTETLYQLLPEIIVLLFATATFVVGAFLPGREGWSWLAAGGCCWPRIALYQQEHNRLPPCLRQLPPTRRRIAGCRCPGDLTRPVSQPGLMAIDEFSSVIRWSVLALGLGVGCDRLAHGDGQPGDRIPRFGAVDHRRLDDRRRGERSGLGLRRAGTGFDSDLHHSLPGTGRQLGPGSDDQILLPQHLVVGAVALWLQLPVRGGRLDRTDGRGSGAAGSGCRRSATGHLCQDRHGADLCRLGIPHHARSVPFLRPGRLPGDFAFERRLVGRGAQNRRLDRTGPHRRGRSGGS